MNDFGRLYGQGLQQIAGFQTRAEYGRFSFFVRGEYQHSPSVPGYNAAVAQVIAKQDWTPVQTYNGRVAGDAFRLLDTYVSMRLLGHEISVGKQSFWWGPGSASAMMLSDNAEPIYALRINRTSPWHVPLLSKLLGPFRHESYFGKLSGHQFPAQAYFYGQKVSFQPTPNVELGFSRDVVFGGTDNAPLTLGTFWSSLTSVSSGTVVGVSTRNLIGARHGAFDFRYRVPKLRNLLTLYADSVIHDDISPVDAPRRAAITPGIYLARLPGLSRVDFHFEAGTTDMPIARAKGGLAYYWESIYRDAYLNKGNLMGSWLGREATGGHTWLTYSWAPHRTFKIGYRSVKTSLYYIPQGGTQADGYAEFNCGWKQGVSLQALVQAERWRIPVLAPTPQWNVTTQFRISLAPNWGRANK